MHICFVGEVATPTVKTGGIGTFVANISSELVNQGHTVSIVSFKSQRSALEIEHLHGFTIYWVSTKQWWRFRIFKVKWDTNRVIRSIHKTQKIDIVETPENGLFGIRKIPGVHYVVRLNGGHVFFAKSTTDTPSSFKKRVIEKFSLRNADAIIGVSKYVLEQTRSYYPFIQHKPSAIIHNPISVERFNPAELSVLPTEDKILFYGALTEKKGVRQLVEAMTVIHADMPSVSLHIYGRDIAIRPSGKSFKLLLKGLIKEKGIKNVFINEALPNNEMPGLIASAAVVVLPSHMEAMPLAWLEAMAMARPFVGSSLGPGPEVVKVCQDGLLCDPLNPDDIASKVMYLLKHTDEAEAMGQAARTKVIENFNAAYLAQQNIAFYQTLV
jgi:glycosyltransferase involved in cell wall biosynthesis